MHYYSFNIGDYLKSTSHLDIYEDMAYRRLLDIYYDTEKPIPDDIDNVVRLIRMKNYKKETQQVLEEFFNLTKKGWIQKRADKEIKSFAQKAVTARANGKLGGRPVKTQPVNSGLAKETQTKAKQEPLTNNHKPINNNKDKSKPLAKANTPDTKEIFNYWLNVMSKPSSLTKLTPKRETAIKNRLKDGYTPEQIKAAIVGCSNDDFSMGQNDRNKAFNDIELICRTGEKLEGFIESGAGIEPDLSFMDGSILDIKQGAING